MFIAGFPAGALQANCWVVARSLDDPDEGVAEDAGDGADPDQEWRDGVVIDPGQEAVERLEALLAEHRIRPVAVLLTHGHIDHVHSAAEVCRSHGIPAFLHPADGSMLDDPLSSLGPQGKVWLAGVSMDGLRPPDTRSIADGDQLDLAGLTVVVDHTPGHTGGSVVYRVPAAPDRPEVLFTGDTLFNRGVGRTDLPGGDTVALARSLTTKLLTRPDDAVVLPGHGPTSTIGDERIDNPFLTQLTVDR
ncbi:MBL fold metallo-hydrolase [Nakamurella leprariae]|uniref:MBL fold metallo-hydrolase n=1 Tax=Nakamurella leprariae TaxID=2803911 RepID=A0A938YCC5_9ACTN|nr:MBL fold metallo-hydrolase [Nakamurella leprariae]MBM9467023.1 MBL fold metallo-hydrolase [Nakamurella leprariae]